MTVTTFTIGAFTASPVGAPATFGAQTIAQTHTNQNSVVTSFTMGTLQAVSIPIVTISFTDLLTTVITGSNCPPFPQPPLTGQRYFGEVVFL